MQSANALAWLPRYDLLDYYLFECSFETRWLDKQTKRPEPRPSFVVSKAASGRSKHGAPELCSIILAVRGAKKSKLHWQQPSGRHLRHELCIVPQILSWPTLRSHPSAHACAVRAGVDKREMLFSGRLLVRKRVRSQIYASFHRQT